MDSTLRNLCDVLDAYYRAAIRRTHQPTFRRAWQTVKVLSSVNATNYLSNRWLITSFLTRFANDLPCRTKTLAHLPTSTPMDNEVILADDLLPAAKRRISGKCCLAQSLKNSQKHGIQWRRNVFTVCPPWSGEWSISGISQGCDHDNAGWPTNVGPRWFTAMLW